MPEYPHILHIFAQNNSATDIYCHTLAEMQITSDSVLDCYAGLACLVRKGHQAYQAILVDLSDLSRSDCEFFLLVNRRFRTLPVWTYGSPAANLFAEGEIDVVAYRHLEPEELGSRLEELVLITAAAARQTETSTPTSPLTDLLVDQIVQPLEEIELQPGGEPILQDDSDIKAMDIDKHREQTQSSRQKPKPKERLNTARSPAGAESESLLTEEELEALLGDNPSSQNQVEQQRSGEES